jgi:hypothetical protein
MDRSEATHGTSGSLDQSLRITGTSAMRDVLRLDFAGVRH